jgi:hypothetical protein
MWTLLLIAMHINNPSDQPGRIEIEFKDRASCEFSLASMKFELKFKSFKVEGECRKLY